MERQIIKKGKRLYKTHWASRLTFLWVFSLMMMSSLTAPIAFARDNDEVLATDDFVVGDVSLVQEPQELYDGITRESERDFSLVMALKEPDGSYKDVYIPGPSGDLLREINKLPAEQKADFLKKREQILLKFAKWLTLFSIPIKGALLPLKYGLYVMKDNKIFSKTIEVTGRGYQTTLNLFKQTVLDTKRTVGKWKDRIFNRNGSVHAIEDPDLFHDQQEKRKSHEEEGHRATFLKIINNALLKSYLVLLEKDAFCIEFHLSSIATVQGPGKGLETVNKLGGGLFTLVFNATFEFKTGHVVLSVTPHKENMDDVVTFTGLVGVNGRGGLGLVASSAVRGEGYNMSVLPGPFAVLNASDRIVFLVNFPVHILLYMDGFLKTIGLAMADAMSYKTISHRLNWLFVRRYEYEMNVNPERIKKVVNWVMIKSKATIEFMKILFPNEDGRDFDPASPNYVEVILSMMEKSYGEHRSSIENSRDWLMRSIVDPIKRVASRPFANPVKVLNRNKKSEHVNCEGLILSTVSN